MAPSPEGGPESKGLEAKGHEREHRTARSIAREAALMVLFGVDGAATSPANQAGLEELIQHFFREIVAEAKLAIDTEVRGYAEEIARGVATELTQVDAAIRNASQNWRLERMSRVDRNVLRIGSWELLHDVPRPVAIDEAVELAKRYGSEDSGAFVNGVLDKVASDLKK